MLGNMEGQESFVELMLYKKRDFLSMYEKNKLMKIINFPDHDYSWNFVCFSYDGPFNDKVQNLYSSDNVMAPDLDSLAWKVIRAYEKSSGYPEFLVSPVKENYFFEYIGEEDHSCIERGVTNDDVQYFVERLNVRNASSYLAGDSPHSFSRAQP